MEKTIQITERVASNFDFKDWSKDRDLLFYGIGNRSQGDFLHDDELIIFSSGYPPILRFIDKNDPSKKAEIKSFEIEQLLFFEKYLKSNLGIGLKKLEDVGYHDIEITDNTKASFRFSGSTPVNRISIGVIEIKDSENYSLTEFDDKNKKWINQEVKIEADIYAEVSLLIEMNNKKSILIKYIKDFEMYFALIGYKSEIEKRNYFHGRLQIAGRTKTMELKEKTIYTI